MNRQKDTAQLAPGEYALMANGRIRNGGPQPITLPQDLSSTLPPFGNLQGVYGFDNFLLVFADGLCYFRDYDVSDTSFHVQPGFQMSATAPVIYACSVPASTINYNRTPQVDAGTGLVIASGGVQLVGSLINGSPACIVCQDGTSQPFLILPDGSARAAQTYIQWDANNVREYVPVGTMMLWINNKLYCLIKDTVNRFTMIASSVSGRPLDFVVAIDVNGNKVPSESTGGALAAAYSVDYTPITCLSAVSGAPSTNGLGTSFYAATQKASYLVAPNYNTTIFGEPTYTNQLLFSTGPKNNVSVTDILGDAALIDDSGIKSFNSILQTRFEGRNAPFSAKMNAFFGNADDDNTAIVQDITAAITWSDYGFFAVNTIYGYGVLVYDTLFQSFVSFDQLFGSDVSISIKQFADIKTTTGIRELFFIGGDNKLYQYFGGSTAECGFYIGDFTPTGQGIELKPKILNPVFTRVVESGTVNVDVYLDSQHVDTLSKFIEADADATNIIPYPQSLPFGDNTSDQTRSPAFNLGTIMPGVKLGFWVTWNFKAMLLQANAAGEGNVLASGMKQQARDYAQLMEVIASNEQ
jgi:hypothetical protein